MNGITDPAPIVRAVILGNDNSCTGRKPDEKADEQVDNRGSRATNRGKRFLADKVADDDRIRSVIELSLIHIWSGRCQLQCAELYGFQWCH